MHAMADVRVDLPPSEHMVACRRDAAQVAFRRALEIVSKLAFYGGDEHRIALRSVRTT